MFTHMRARSYTLKKRAEKQDATRRRIVEATMRLHEELGPKNTTISAVAERAGVQRLTVYRHFPNETSLFQACTSHWLSLNPPPDPAGWSAIADGTERCNAALTALYRYFRTTERMWTAAYRDEKEVAALQEPMRQVREYLAAVADGLIEALSPERLVCEETAATLRHAVQFATWKSLSDLGIDDARAAALATRWVTGLLKETRHPGS